MRRAVALRVAPSPLSQLRAKDVPETANDSQQRHRCDDDTALALQAATHAHDSAFTLRTRTGKWPGTNAIIRDQRHINENLTDCPENLTKSLYVSPRPQDRLGKLQGLIHDILEKDERDILFGVDSSDDQPIIDKGDIQLEELVDEPGAAGSEPKPEQMVENIIMDKKNLSELEVFNICFDECAELLRGRGIDQSIVETLGSIKNYYVNKIVNKNSSQRSFDGAVKQLDERCALLEGELEHLQMRYQELYQKHQDAEAQCARLRQQNTAQAIEREKLVSEINKVQNKAAGAEKSLDVFKANAQSVVEENYALRKRIERTGDIVREQRRDIDHLQVQLHDRMAENALLAEEKEELQGRTNELDRQCREKDSLYRQVVDNMLKLNEYILDNYLTREELESGQLEQCVTDSMSFVNSLIEHSVTPQELVSGSFQQRSQALRRLFGSLKNAKAAQAVVDWFKGAKLYTLATNSVGTSIDDSVLLAQIQPDYTKVQYIRQAGGQERQAKVATSSIGVMTDTMAGSPPWIECCWPCVEQEITATQEQPETHQELPKTIAKPNTREPSARRGATDNTNDKRSERERDKQGRPKKGKEQGQVAKDSDEEVMKQLGIILDCLGVAERRKYTAATTDVLFRHRERRMHRKRFNNVVQRITRLINSRPAPDALRAAVVAELTHFVAACGGPNLQRPAKHTQVKRQVDASEQQRGKQMDAKARAHLSLRALSTTDLTAAAEKVVMNVPRPLSAIRQECSEPCESGLDRSGIKQLPRRHSEIITGEIAKEHDVLQERQVTPVEVPQIVATLPQEAVDGAKGGGEGANGLQQETSVEICAEKAIQVQFVSEEAPSPLSTPEVSYKEVQTEKGGLDELVDDDAVEEELKEIMGADNGEPQSAMDILSPDRAEGEPEHEMTACELERASADIVQFFNGLGRPTVQGNVLPECNLAAHIKEQLLRLIRRRQAHREARRGQRGNRYAGIASIFDSPHNKFHFQKAIGLQACGYQLLEREDRGEPDVAKQQPEQGGQPAGAPLISIQSNLQAHCDQVVYTSVFDVHPKAGQPCRRDTTRLDAAIPPSEHFLLENPIDRAFHKYMKEGASFAPCILCKEELSDADLRALGQFYQAELTGQPAAGQPPNPAAPGPKQPVRFIRLSALSLREDAEAAAFNLYDSRLETATVCGKQYIVVPTKNCYLKSEQWTMRAMFEVIRARCNAKFSYIVKRGGTPDGFVQIAHSYQRLHFECFAEFVAAYFKSKYGGVQLCQSLLLTLYASVAYHQYGNGQVYLFARVLFGDLPLDAELTYFALYKCVGCSAAVRTELVSNLVSAVFRNWSAQRQFGFLQRLLAEAYDCDEGRLPAACDTGALAARFLRQYCAARRVVWQQLRWLLRGALDGAGGAPGVGPFRQLCQLALPFLQPEHVDAMFHAYGGGLRHMGAAGLRAFFAAHQLGRFAAADPRRVADAAAPALRKLVAGASLVYRRMDPVVRQLAAIAQRRAEAGGGAYSTVAPRVRGCMATARQDLLAYDLQGAVRAMKDVFGIVVDTMAETQPEISVAAVAGAMSALRSLMRAGYDG